MVSVPWRFLFFLVLGMGCDFFIVALPGPSVNYFVGDMYSFYMNDAQFIADKSVWVFP